MIEVAAQVARPATLRLVRRLSAGAVIGCLLGGVAASAMLGPGGWTLVAAGGVCISAGLVGLASGWPRVARLASAAAGSVALVALLGALWPGSAPVRMLVATTPVAMLVAGAVAVIGGAFGSRAVARMALLTGGFVLLGLAVSQVFVRIAGSFDLLGPRAFGGIPWGVAAGGLTLGLGAIGVVWSFEPNTGPYPSWLPAAAATAGVAASLLLWQALAAREDLQVRRLVDQAAASEARALGREIAGMSRGLNQFALWHNRVNEPDVDPASTLTLLQRDVPAATALALIDSTGQPIVALPADADLGAFRQAVPSRALDDPRGQPSVALLRIPGDTSRFIIHAADCTGGACPGGAAALVTAAALLQRTSLNTAFWNFRLGPHPDSQVGTGYQNMQPLELPGLDWTLTTTPTPAMLGATQSAVPEIALTLGLVLSVLLALTAHVAAQSWDRARQAERLRIAGAIARSTDAIWEWDAEHGTLRRSGDLWQHLGYPAERVAGTWEEWVGLIHPDDRERIRASFLRMVDGHEAEFEAEYRVQSSLGDWHLVADRGRVVDRAPDGSARLVMGLSADVTATRRAEQHLREAEALSGMGRVAARVAHEVNNPLAGIRSAFALVKDAVPTDHPHHHYVGAIEREVERIANVTRHLYEVYRPEHEPVGASLGTIAGDAVALLGEVNRRTGVRLVLDLDGVPSIVPFSGGMLRQVIYNLVQNAVDASPAGGEVRLSARVAEERLVLQVADQGQGVPTELRERIFDPFFTTKDASVRTGGMGLGLSMVARSVASAAGTIHVDDAPGGGARFTVSLPLASEGARS